MNDLNFFYEFIEEKRNKNISITLSLFAVLFILGGVVSSVFYLERDIYREKVNIDNHNKMLRSTQVSKLDSNFKSISENERVLKESLTQIQSIKAYVAGLNKITTHGIVRIFNAIPKNVSISSFEYNQKQLSMDCESSDRKGVASTINNLKGVGLKEVNVPSIVAVDNDGVTTYRFSISAKIEEMKNHEDN
ncbi:PilN domain-containing protein [Oceanirhabdus seepicola]|uniref:PilN domain-containing protein n=1 Tax=Oceanirhabdus seepicola TaxID=2828781 RepID=A0A9J6P1F7_9CLOT|nr:PilN domain-containing protein [Oceanirhabdus seepicola]MCM1990570.1 PilN domain-containing protein [Oceanirhabdus seepicola]